jgi:hypothetical protein
MPNPKSTVKQPGRLKRFGAYLWHHPKELVALIMLLALVVTPFAIWATTVQNNHEKTAAIAKERAQFAQAEGETTVAKNRVITFFRQPDYLQKNNSCMMRSQDEGSSEKNYYCFVGYYIAYKVTNQQMARDLASQITVSMKNSSFKATDPGIEELSRLPVDLGSDNFSTSTNLVCGMGYQYVVVNDHSIGGGLPRIPFNDGDKALLEDISCASSQWVITPYYPLQSY